jgi:hypothetical protein
VDVPSGDCSLTYANIVKGQGQTLTLTAVGGG